MLNSIRSVALNFSYPEAVSRMNQTVITRLRASRQGQKRTLLPTASEIKNCARYPALPIEQATLDELHIHVTESGLRTTTPVFLTPIIATYQGTLYMIGVSIVSRTFSGVLHLERPLHSRLFKLFRNPLLFFLPTVFGGLALPVVGFKVIVERTRYIFSITSIFKTSSFTVINQTLATIKLPNTLVEISKTAEAIRWFNSLEPSERYSAQQTVMNHSTSGAIRRFLRPCRAKWHLDCPTNGNAI